MTTVKRYEPEIDERWYKYESEPSRTAVMKESGYGEWVELSTYENETKRLQKQIDRLKLKIKALEEQNAN